MDENFNNDFNSFDEYQRIIEEQEEIRRMQESMEQSGDSSHNNVGHSEDHSQSRFAHRGINVGNDAKSNVVGDRREFFKDSNIQEKMQPTIDSIAKHIDALDGTALYKKDLEQYNEDKTYSRPSVSELTAAFAEDFIERTENNIEFLEESIDVFKTAQEQPEKAGELIINPNQSFLDKNGIERHDDGTFSKNGVEIDGDLVRFAFSKTDYDTIEIENNEAVILQDGERVEIDEEEFATFKEMVHEYYPEMFSDQPEKFDSLISSMQDSIEFKKSEVEELKKDLEQLKSEIAVNKELGEDVDSKLESADDRAHLGAGRLNTFNTWDRLELMYTAYKNDFKFEGGYVTKTELFMTAYTFTRTNLFESLLETALYKVLDHIETREDFERYKNTGSVDKPEGDPIEKPDGIPADTIEKAQDIDSEEQDKGRSDSVVKVGGLEITDKTEIHSSTVDGKKQNDVFNNGEKIDAGEIKAFGVTAFGTRVDRRGNEHEVDNFVKNEFGRILTSDNKVIIGVPVMIDKGTITEDDSRVLKHGTRNGEKIAGVDHPIFGAYIVVDKNGVDITDSSMKTIYSDKIGQEGKEANVNIYDMDIRGVQRSILDNDALSDNTRTTLSETAINSMERGIAKDIEAKSNEIESRIETLRELRSDVPDTVKPDIDLKISRLQDALSTLKETGGDRMESRAAKIVAFERVNNDETLFEKIDNEDRIREDKTDKEQDILETRITDNSILMNVERDEGRVTITSEGKSSEFDIDAAEKSLVEDRIKYVENSDMDSEDKQKLSSIIEDSGRFADTIEEIKAADFKDKEKADKVIATIYKADIERSDRLDISDPRKADLSGTAFEDIKDSGKDSIASLSKEYASAELRIDRIDNTSVTYKLDENADIESKQEYDENGKLIDNETDNNDVEQNETVTDDNIENTEAEAVVNEDESVETAVDDTQTADDTDLPNENDRSQAIDKGIEQFKDELKERIPEDKYNAVDNGIEKARDEIKGAFEKAENISSPEAVADVLSAAFDKTKLDFSKKDKQIENKVASEIGKTVDRGLDGTDISGRQLSAKDPLMKAVGELEKEPTVSQQTETATAATEVPEQEKADIASDEKADTEQAYDVDPKVDEFLSFEGRYDESFLTDNFVNYLKTVDRLAFVESWLEPEERAAFIEDIVQKFSEEPNNPQVAKDFETLVHEKGLDLDEIAREYEHPGEGMERLVSPGFRGLDVPMIQGDYTEKEYQKACLELTETYIDNLGDPDQPMTIEDYLYQLSVDRDETGGYYISDISVDNIEEKIDQAFSSIADYAALHEARGDLDSKIENISKVLGSLAVETGAICQTMEVAEDKFNGVELSEDLKEAIIEKYSETVSDLAEIVYGDTDMIEQDEDSQIEVEQEQDNVIGVVANVVDVLIPNNSDKEDIKDAIEKTLEKSKTTVESPNSFTDRISAAIDKIVDGIKEYHSSMDKEAFINELESYDADNIEQQEAFSDEMFYDSDYIDNNVEIEIDGVSMYDFDDDDDDGGHVDKG